MRRSHIPLRLQTSTKEKLVIWEQLKVTSFTRAITGVYALAIVLTFLRVQLNIVGGYLYAQALVSDDGGGSRHLRVSRSVGTPSVLMRS